MRLQKKTLALVAIPLALGGWAAFRPELLFVNQTVSEKAPAMTQSLAMGMFESYAHETLGEAQLLSAEGKSFLRLTDFHTSNGPDVRVLLVKGDNPQNVEGAIELGTLKGNKGDQNYAIPAGTNLSDYRAVNIWCKRFSVAFGGARLEVPKEQARQDFFQVASYTPSTVEVTFGKIKGNPGFAGRFALVETDGKRFAKLDLSKLPAGSFKATLVKKETLELGTLPKLPSIDLGALRQGVRQVSIPKEIDLWLYRSIAITDESGKVIATVSLRSAQEKPTLFFI